MDRNERPFLSREDTWKYRAEAVACLASRHQRDDQPGLIYLHVVSSVGLEAVSYPHAAACACNPPPAQQMKLTGGQ